MFTYLICVATPETNKILQSRYFPIVLSCCGFRACSPGLCLCFLNCSGLSGHQLQEWVLLPLAVEGTWPWGCRQEGGAIPRTVPYQKDTESWKSPHPRSLYFLLDLGASFDLETNPFFLSLFLFPPLSIPSCLNQFRERRAYGGDKFPQITATLTLSLQKSSAEL